jgi:hypothetical protein
MKTELHPVEVVILCAVALAWAVVTIARTLLVPLLAMLITLVRHRPAPAPEAPLQPTPEPAQPVLPPVTLAAIAEELQALPAAHLRSITGCRRKVAKRVMLDAWLAMPI